jgi:acetyl-CoA carboxylase carboxyl transferase subunit alpha
LATYLDFEQKICQIQEDIIAAEVRYDHHAVAILKQDLDKEVQQTYTNLSPYQELQLARHADRPYAIDYINLLFDKKYELHGDRHFRDDLSIVCYLGTIDDERVMIIGEQKGRGTKNKLKRNFGMPNPEGYRKALRMAKMAEKFHIPVLMLIDTPGAYPGLGAEERNQSEAIARNLLELSNLNTITVSIVIGEGGSGGALAIGVADRLAMMRYSVISVISPERCSAILWNDPSKVEAATKALKITSEDLKALDLIDDVIDEPLIGAHRDKVGAAGVVKDYFLSKVKELRNLSDDERLEKRYNRLVGVGKYSE